MHLLCTLMLSLTAIINLRITKKHEGNNAEQADTTVASPDYRMETPIVRGMLG